MLKSTTTAPLRDILKYLRVFQSFVGARMYAIFVLALLAALAESVGIVMLLPLLQMMDFMSAGSPSGIGRIFYEALSWLGLGDSIIAILLFITMFFFFKAFFLFLAFGYRGYLHGLLLRELQSRIYDDYTRMRLEYYVSKDTGYFVNLMNKQIYDFVSSFGSMINLGTAFAKMLIYVAIALFVAWHFGLMAIILGLVLLLAFYKLNGYVRELSRKTANEVGILSNLIIQSLQSFKYLTATAQNAKTQKWILQSIRRITSFFIRTEIAKAFTTASREPMLVITILIIVMIQVTWLNQSLGPIMVSILLFHRALGATFDMQASWQETLSRVGALEMVRDEFHKLNEQREPDGTHELGAFTHAIKLDDVHFSYSEAKAAVLNGISLIIPAKASVAIVGESGSGKTTLVDLLTLILKPTRGRISIDGVPAETIHLPTWRSQIGYVSQETVVFDDTIANNICLWEGDIKKDPALFERIRHAASQAHLEHVIESLPGGYQTLVGDRGLRLSGGQRQRLFIARELFRRPNLLILDEATSALDSDSELAIRSSIDALKGQITMIVIAHRLATIRNVDQVYVLDHGKIVEKGSYVALREDPNSRLSKLIAAQKL